MTTPTITFALSDPVFACGIEAARCAHEDQQDFDATHRGSRSSSPIIRQAMAYCELGWPVLVLEPRGKRPTGPNAGVRSASARSSVVLGRLDAVPGANIGIRLGAVSGLVGVDIDGPSGEESWAAIWDDQDEPSTLSAVSGRAEGGRHLYFSHDFGSGPVLRAGNNALGAAIDVKADNGYLVAPPSVHSSGAAYRWVDITVPILGLPDRLVDLLAPRIDSTHFSDTTAAGTTRFVSPVGHADTAWGMAALRGITRDLAECPPGGGSHGGRDNLANWSYHRVGRIVAGGNLTSSTALASLAQALDTNGLGSGAEKLAAFEAGLNSPVSPGNRAQTVQSQEHAETKSPKPDPPYTTTPLTASELVSIYYEEEETNSDIHLSSAPAHHWLAGRAPEFWCNPDGLYRSIKELDLPDCAFGSHMVLLDRLDPEYLDWAVTCRVRACPSCHVLEFLKFVRRVSAWSRKCPIQEWYFATFPDKKNWGTFARRQNGRKPRVQYVRIPGASRHVVLGATTKEFEDDWFPLDGQEALFDAWAAFWFTLEPGPNEYVTSTGEWRRPRSRGSGRYERIGITGNIDRFHQQAQKHGGTVNGGPTWSTTNLPPSVWSDAAKVADIESTVHTGPEQTMFLTEPNPDMD